MDEKEKPRPDWESFETYKGPEDEGRLPKWCYKLIDAFMISLGAAIIFAISGGLFYLWISNKLDDWMGDNPTSAWIKFGVGGCLGLGFAAYYYFRKTPHHDRH